MHQGNCWSFTHLKYVLIVTVSQCLFLRCCPDIMPYKDDSSTAWLLHIPHRRQRCLFLFLLQCMKATLKLRLFPLGEDLICSHLFINRFPKGVVPCCCSCRVTFGQIGVSHNHVSVLCWLWENMFHKIFYINLYSIMPNESDKIIISHW